MGKPLPLRVPLQNVGAGAEVEAVRQKLEPLVQNHGPVSCRAEHAREVAQQRRLAGRRRTGQQQAAAQGDPLLQKAVGAAVYFPGNAQRKARDVPHRFQRSVFQHGRAADADAQAAAR